MEDEKENTFYQGKFLIVAKVGEGLNKQVREGEKKDCTSL